MTNVVDPRSKIKLVTLNGKMVPLEEAKISVMAPGFTFAATVFEGIRAYWNEENQQLYLLCLDEHLNRLQDSMKLVKFSDPPSSKELKHQIIECLRANQYKEDIYIRLSVFVDDWGSMNATGPISSAIVAYPRPRIKAFTQGRDFGISTWRRLSDNASPPRIKAAANYLNSRLAGLDAAASGYEGAILLTEKGTVSEGPGGCLFLVRDQVLLTPSVTSGILEGITRKILITLAKDAGYQVIEREIDRTELYLADEGFYCGTGSEIIPINSIDRFALGSGNPGPITQKLQNLYDLQIRNCSQKYQSWQTSIYE